MSNINLITEVKPDAPLWLIGCGKMGRALLDGWLAAGLNPLAVRIIDPSAHETCPTQILAEQCYDDVATIADGQSPSIIVLAVKPQVLPKILLGLKGLSLHSPLVISVAAGITIDAIAKSFAPSTPIIRTMPNTPASIGKGITAMVANDFVIESGLELANAMFTSSGEVVILDDEGLIDVVTAVSGSGPAYVFYMLEAMMAAGVDMGLPDDVAQKLARQTIIGAAGLLEASAQEAATLRENVTSPNGTTEAALKVLMADDGLGQLMAKAMLKARDRGRELSGSN